MTLQAIGGASALASAVALLDGSSRTRAWAWVPGVTEMSSVLLMLAAAAAIVGAGLWVLIWFTCRGHRGGLPASVAFLVVASGPGLVAGVLPGAVTICAVVILTRPGVRKHVRARSERRG